MSQNSPSRFEQYVYVKRIGGRKLYTLEERPCIMQPSTTDECQTQFTQHHMLSRDSSHTLYLPQKAATSFHCSLWLQGDARILQGRRQCMAQGRNASQCHLGDLQESCHFCTCVCCVLNKASLFFLCHVVIKYTISIQAELQGNAQLPTARIQGQQRPLHQLLYSC